MKYYVVRVFIDDADESVMTHTAYCESKKAAKDYARQFTHTDIAGPLHMKLTKSNVIQLVNNESIPI